jgi:DNA-binding beta-propeller fold protein YncE
MEAINDVKRAVSNPPPAREDRKRARLFIKPFPKLTESGLWTGGVRERSNEIKAKVIGFVISGVVTTVFGISGLNTPGSIDGVAPFASFNLPQGVAVSRNGDIYVADSLGNRIRKIIPRTGAYPASI